MGEHARPRPTAPNWQGAPFKHYARLPGWSVAVSYRQSREQRTWRGGVVGCHRIGRSEGSPHTLSGLPPLCRSDRSWGHDLVEYTRIRAARLANGDTVELPAGDGLGSPTDTRK